MNLSPEDSLKLERIRNYANALYQVVLERYRILPLISTLSAAFVGLAMQNTALVKTSDLAFIALCILISLIPISIFGILYQLDRDSELLEKKIISISSGVKPEESTSTLIKTFPWIIYVIFLIAIILILLSFFEFNK